MQEICLICGEKCDKEDSELSFPIYYCKVCRHYWAVQVPYNENASIYTDYEFCLKSLRIKNFKKILAVLKTILPVGAMGLEVGSALGWFLQLGCESGYKMVGIEPISVNYQRSLSPDNLYRVYNGYFPDDALISHDTKFDFIIFNDVFEHIENTNILVENCLRYLHPNGYVIINLPLNSGILAQSATFLSKFKINFAQKRLWQFDTESPHYHYFSEKSLNKEMGKFGFASAKQIPLDTLPINFMHIRERVSGFGTMPKPLINIFAGFIYLCSPLFLILPRDIGCFFFCKK